MINKNTAKKSTTKTTATKTTKTADAIGVTASTIQTAKLTDNDPKMSAFVKTIEMLFDLINDKIFSNQIPRPIITVQAEGKTRVKSAGWACGKCWVNHEDPNDLRNELNLTAEHLDKSPLELCGTIVHEMVHLYCIEKNIKDTSRQGSFHNELFKKYATLYGLDVKKDIPTGDRKTSYGWNQTSLSESTKELLLKSPLIKELTFAYSRKEVEIKVKQKAPAKSNKYVCPICGRIIRTTDKEGLPVYCGCDGTPHLCEIKERIGE